MKGHYIICYVDLPWVWFTSDLERQWGDDWNDAPRDCNAGEPYHGDTDLVKIAIGDSYFEEANQNLTVQALNRGAASWLVHAKFSDDESYLPIHATMDQTIEWVKQCGGKVYRDDAG